MRERQHDEWTRTVEGIARRFSWMVAIAIVVLLGAALVVGRSDHPTANRGQHSYQQR